MRKVVALLMALLMAMTVAAAAAEGEPDRLAKIKESGELVIGMEGVWQPWTYHDETGALTGFDTEVAALIAEGLGVTPKYVESDFNSCLAGVESGRLDIVCNGVGYNEKRAEAYTFSDIYIYSVLVLVVPENNEDIHTIEDLAGKVTSNSPGSNYAQMALDAGAEVRYVDTLGETMEMLLQGRAEATLNDKDSVDSYLAEHPEAKIKIVQVMPGDPIAIPMLKGQETETLKAEIDRILEELRQNGKLAELSVKYFGEDLTTKQD